MFSWYVAHVFLNDFEIVPVAPVFTGITFCFYISHALYFYCKGFILLLLLWEPLRDKALKPERSQFECKP